MGTQRQAELKRAGGSRGGRGARRRILEAANELFYREGIDATGVERLASEASVSKRTLYRHFPSKVAVVEEYLRTIQRDVGDPIHPGPDAEKRTPRARLLSLFVSPVSNGSLRGCPFHNAAVEAGDAVPEVQSIVREYKREFIGGVTSLAKQARATNPKLLGSQLAVLYEGAEAMSTSPRDPDP